MTSLLDGFRFYFSPLLIVAGSLWSLSGIYRTWTALRLPPLSPGKNLNLMRGFRIAIVGLAIALAATGWLVGSIGLVVLAVVIGLGELMETSLDVWALRREAEYRATRRWTPPYSR